MLGKGRSGNAAGRRRKIQEKPERETREQYAAEAEDYVNPADASFVQHHKTEPHKIRHRRKDYDYTAAA